LTAGFGGRDGFAAFEGAGGGAAAEGKS